MTLTEITKRRDAINRSKMEATKEHHLYIMGLNAEDERLAFLEKLILYDVNIMHVQTAEKLLNVNGNIDASVDDRVIADAAALDIANGCQHLRKRFFGNKRYESFYQSCDCEYGYGPKHGYIVDRVELIDNQIQMTDEQKEACIYYLKNYRKIKSAKTKNNKNA